MADQGGVSEKIKAWAANNLNFLFGLLRVFKPILVYKQLAVVTRFADVQEVLTRDDAFTVTYAEKMKMVGDGSNFFLGMGPTPEYTRDVTNMRLGVRRTDVDTIVAPMIDEIATEIVGQANGKIDAVHDLTRIVPSMLVERYMGLPGPTRDDLIDWTTSLFYYLFFPDIPAEANRLAEQNAAAARNHIDKLIADRKQSGEEADDVLGRLIKLQGAGAPEMTDEYIRNNMLGIIIGAIPTTSKCAALVLDYLLDHPETMARAKAVAKRNDIKALNNYVLESLRFNPFGPAIFRECIQDYKIAKGTFRSKTIRKGTRVLVATLSAMWDGREIKNPKRFDCTRPRYQYMHYGYGVHTCFGEYINDVQIALIIKSLLVKDNLQRATGDAGKLAYDGDFPNHLHLTFDP